LWSSAATESLSPREPCLRIWTEAATAPELRPSRHRIRRVWWLDVGALAFAAVEALLAGLGVQRSTPATGGGGGGSEGKGGAAAAPLLLAAVAHAQMDREHEGLADAADALRQQRSLASLRRLRRGGDAAEMRRDAGRCGSLASSRCS